MGRRLYAVLGTSTLAEMIFVRSKINCILSLRHIGDPVSHNSGSMTGLTKEIISMEDRTSRQLTLYTYRNEAEA